MKITCFTKLTLFWIYFGFLTTVKAQKRVFIFNSDTLNAARLDYQLENLPFKPSKIYYLSSLLSYTDASCLQTKKVDAELKNKILNNVLLLKKKRLKLDYLKYKNIPIQFYGFSNAVSYKYAISCISSLSPDSFPNRYSVYFDAIKSYEKELDYKTHFSGEFSQLANYFDTIKNELKSIYKSNFEMVENLWKEWNQENEILDLVKKCDELINLDTTSIVIIELNFLYFYSKNTSLTKNTIQTNNLVELIQTQNSLKNKTISYFQNPIFYKTTSSKLLNFKIIKADSIFGDSTKITELNIDNTDYIEDNFITKWNKNISISVGNTIQFSPKGIQHSTQNKLLLNTISFNLNFDNEQYGFTYSFFNNPEFTSDRLNTKYIISLQNYQFNQRNLIKHLKLGKIAKMDFLFGSSLYYSRVKLKDIAINDNQISNKMSEAYIFRQNGFGLGLDLSARASIREFLFIQAGAGYQFNRFQKTSWRNNDYYYPAFKNYKFTNCNLFLSVGFVI